jgi:class 3 adenylate cyclase
VVVGNIGMPGRINYTVVGDTVNSCQRLEALGKEVSGEADGDVTILISSATKALIDESFETVLMGDFSVKGRKEALEVYRLVTGPIRDPDGKDASY